MNCAIKEILVQAVDDIHHHSIKQGEPLPTDKTIRIAVEFLEILDLKLGNTTSLL